MCFGGGKSAKTSEEFYREMKPSFGALPSLKQDAKADRPSKEMKDVVKTERVGQKRRSLLMYGGE